jgi:hypothetical protein
MQLFQPHEWMAYTETFDLKNLDIVDFSVVTANDNDLLTTVQVWGVLRSTEQGEHFFLLDESQNHYDTYAQLDDEFARLHRTWETTLPRQTCTGVVWCADKVFASVLTRRHAVVAVPQTKSGSYRDRIATLVTARRRVWIPAETWGSDPTNPSLPLITNATVNVWTREMASPTKPDTQRSATVQQLICRASELGVHLLAA